jgi:Flp pilus assembly protein TadB
MTAVGLAGVAAALLLLPWRRPGRQDERDALRDRPTDRRDGLLAGPRAPALAAGLVAVAAIAVLGPLRGAFAGAVVAPLVGAGIRVLQRRPAPEHPDRSLAIALDLCAAALRAGRTPADALAAALPAADHATAAALGRVAGLLRLGADPVRAWQVLDADGPLGSVAATAARSAVSGIRSATAFERLADEIRADCAAAAAARAQRAGVLAIAPLAACFLPAFVCLGIVPTVVGVAGSVLT